jgi:HAD superfamily hydrolase (TIGR01484 family)
MHGVTQSGGAPREQGTRMLPFSLCPPSELARIAVVLTDIDDTLTLDGRLPAIAYSALERLRGAGLIVVPVTGRPAGWCDLIARLWPVDGVVGENGAFYFRCEPGRGMKRIYVKDESERREDRVRLVSLGASILAAVPCARIAADQLYRESDLAIDFAEDGAPLAPAKIDRIAACFAEAGATAKVSSIHVNGWYGGYDKLGMTRRMLADEFGLDVDANNARVAFVGDSPNDAPMFGFLRNSIGVANFRAFSARSEAHPRWITAAAGGAGFAEFASRLLAARGAA